jgi:transketolase
MTSGSLGNGIAIGAGMAFAAKATGRDYYTYVICGDGELQEGVCWEGINMATGRKLDNLIVFADRNGWQSYKSVEFTVGQNNLADRFRAFGWHTLEIDGHDIGAIKSAVANAKKHKGQPHCIVCDCVKGKGLSFMENNNAWHKGVPTDEQYEIAVRELSTVQ